MSDQEMDVRQLRQQSSTQRVELPLASSHYSGLVQRSELDPAQVAVVHEPAFELLLAALHPESNLFEMPIRFSETVAHHRNLQKALVEHGITVYKVGKFIRHLISDVFQVKDVLIEAAERDSSFRKQLEQNAMAALTYVFEGDISTLDEDSKFYLSPEYKAEVIAVASASDLVGIILQQPTVILAEAELNAKFMPKHTIVRFVRSLSVTCGA